MGNKIRRQKNRLQKWTNNDELLIFGIKWKKQQKTGNCRQKILKER
jgi:hypothetical protein